jgi:hypothetical protein
VDVALAVEFLEPLIELEDLGAPWRNVLESVVEDDLEDEEVPDAVELLPARIVPIPRMVDDPKVVVLVEEPLDIVERI